ncbi:phosphatase PAP2 family protein [Sediminibacterium soli]|uniref:phosphatase PAP2 family protein n=1 Tax=Sediminibacterium soli TaxID=2698829 RepID=UPI0013798E78|nr:phosphatase PAP2 family protein [Sediminibacterium soli]NCI46625.1 phosphatase PAP2 family protein [Sediminibacterium soli]
MRKTILSLLSVMLCATCFAQGGWEVDMVRSINPQNPAASFTWRTLSNTAKPLSVAVPAGMLAVALLEKNTSLRNNALEMAAGLAITTVATAGIKSTVNRERPYQRYTDIYPDSFDDAKSFPSGHASVAFSTAASLALQYKKWYITVPAFAWAGAVGYSRLYMGQHYPTDILGSALTGIGSAWAAHWLRGKLFGKKANPRTADQRIVD